MPIRIDRRMFIGGAGAALFAGHSDAATPVFTNADPASAGFSADMPAKLDQLIASKRVWGLHGVIVVRNRKIALERYFEGEENSWGTTRHVAFGPDTLHNLYSVTKSIVALVYGVALAEGKVPPPEAPLYAQFPEYADLVAADPRRGERTVAHALTMTLGLQWDEITIPYSDPKNDEIGMEMAKDRYRFILDRPVIEPPGKRWLYSGGDTALLGRLIAKGTGQSLPDYARKVLFEPLDLGPTEWITNRETWVARQYGPGDGEPVAASGLRMRPRDLARVGQMMLDKGKAGATQVVPMSWLEQCVTPRVSADEQRRYGYQWYVGDLAYGTRERPHLDRWWGCFGNGGQRLWVMPDLDLVAINTAGNYGTGDEWIPPVRIMREVVLPSLQ